MPEPPPPGYALQIAPFVFDFLVSSVFWPKPIATIRERLIAHVARPA